MAEPTMKRLAASRAELLSTSPFGLSRGGESRGDSLDDTLNGTLNRSSPSARLPTRTPPAKASTLTCDVEVPVEIRFECRRGVSDPRYTRPLGGVAVGHMGAELAFRSSDGAAHYSVTVVHELGDRLVLTQPASDPDNQLHPHSNRQLLQRLERRPGPPALHPSNRRLCRAHTLGKFGLGQPGLGPQPEDELTELAETRLVFEPALPCHRPRPADVLPCGPSIIVVLHRVLLGDTTFQRASGPIDLLSFLPAGLYEHRQKHDPAPRGDPVRDPSGIATEVEPQLTQLPLQLLGVRFIQQRTTLSQPVDVKPDAATPVLIDASYQSRTSGSSSTSPHDIAPLLFLASPDGGIRARGAATGQLTGAAVTQS